VSEWQGETVCVRYQLLAATLWLNQKHSILLRKSYNLAEPYSSMEEKRTMPICFTSDQLKMIEEYAKRRGMLNLSQAIEDLISK
jgi:hypothetical protein